MKEYMSRERRTKQSQLIRKWRPWTRSTGPKTFDSKACSSRNAFKHGAKFADTEDLLKFYREILHMQCRIHSE